MLLLALFACGGDAPPTETPAPAAMPAMPTMPATPEPAQAPEPPADPARAAADEAFNTAMRAYETGAPDGVKASQDALKLYLALPFLDEDGRFHVALLQTAAGDFAGAQASCDALLQAHPNHLLAIGAAARAAKKAGDAAAAKKWYQRFVDAWDAPREDLPEYEEHAKLLPILQKEAMAYLVEAG